MGNISKSIGALLSNTSNELIKEEIYKLYPYWNKTRFNMLVDENLKYVPWAKKNFSGFTPYGQDEEFSDLRKLFLFPALESKKADIDTKEVAEEIDKLYKRPQDVIPSLRE